MNAVGTVTYLGFHLHQMGLKDSFAAFLPNCLDRLGCLGYLKIFLVSAFFHFDLVDVRKY